MLLVAFVAMPAMASVQNVKISGSIDSTWLLRNNFNLGLDDQAGDGQTFDDTAVGDETQNLFITQTMVMVDADLTDNVSTTVCLINERSWNQKDTTTADDSDIDLHLAYVTLREMLYSPLTVVVGRQAFHYGNSFIVDSSGTNNSAPTDSGIAAIAGDLTKQTALDAIRLIFDYEPLTLEFLVSKVNSRTNTLVADDQDDTDLYGANATYEVGDSMNTQVEAYFFARIDRSSDGNPNDGDKADTVYVPGLRASTNPIEGLNVQAEVAWQRGNRVATTSQTNGSPNNERREALGAQVIASYQVPVLEEYKPLLEYVYTYVSGDSNPDDRGTGAAGSGEQASSNKFTAWDPMFESQAGGTIYNALFNLSNAHIHTVSAQVSPIEDVTTKVSWTNLRLDKDLERQTATSSFVLIQPDGAASTQSVFFNADESEVGNEVDVSAIYDYTEDVQIGANFGWFMPGDLFTNRNDSIASQAIIHGNVNF